MTHPQASTRTDTAPFSHTRILFINDTARNGGPGHTLVCLLKFLDPAKIHRTVLLPREDVVSREVRRHRAAERVIIEPALIENLLQPWSRSMARRDFTAPAPLRLWRGVVNIVRAATGLARLARHVRAERYDLIFCNGTVATLIGGIVAAATRVPAIWHVFYPCVPSVIRPLHRALAAGSRVRAILCVSRAVSGQFSSCPQKVQICHDALDLQAFDATARTPCLRAELGLGDDSVIFGAHGRIVRHKGFIELIRAARLMLDQLDTAQRPRCHFVVLGDTPEDMPEDHLAQCRALARELGVDDAVHFIGFRAEVAPYVAEFDVALIPSIYPDPLPRAVMEAMALNKPVIAFDVGGIGEMVRDHEQGRLLPGHPPDIGGMAQACLDYFHDPDLRQRHGQAARRRVMEEFEARRHASLLQAQLLRLVAHDAREQHGPQ
ncbi:glycosyltransferase [Acetobacter sp. TBRC 12305]|uniref:Glycosyltransferase n=1 Tax=Acetobacter garciniae TaxID=2817435 RepID=A0A939KRQ1_9PROT|nr:glycosyltransferase [Acetobacter garciniae]MBO1325796.1 glycosyltransferase [Acetobacter garciniae]MBX0345696.1 glycosyltransferase [Acetobacter garciniae]